MIGIITKITNLCVDESIDFDCCTYAIDEFDWRSIERRNSKFNYDSQNGGFSTCYRDNIRLVTLRIRYADDVRTERGNKRNVLDRVMTNYDCCETCCSLLIDFTDDDGTVFQMYAKLGSTIVQDRVDGFDIIHDHQFILELCGKIKGTDIQEVCGDLGSIGDILLPNCSCLGIQSCYTGSEIAEYTGNNCGDFVLTVDGNPISNLQVRNITSGGFYGIIGVVNGIVVFDTEAGQVTLNGTRVPSSMRMPGSSLNSLRFVPGENQILVSGVGVGTWCIRWTNDLN